MNNRRADNPAVRVPDAQHFTRRSAACATYLFAIISILFSAFGCAGERGAVRPPYDAVLKDWTDSVRVYNGLDTTIYLTATFKSPQFREAYVTRYADGVKADDALRSMLLAREAEQHDAYNEVFISVYTPEEEWNDLDSPSSVWKLYLEDGSGARLTPVSVKRIDREDVLVKEFFPYYDVWSSAYLVRFPKYAEAGPEPIPGKDTKFLRLVVTGVLGQGSLEWRMK